MTLFEANIDSFATDVDLDLLSDSLQVETVAGTTTSGSQTGLMWLLAHFIVLQKAKGQPVPHSSRSLRILYFLMSALSNRIRAGFTVSQAKPSGEARDVEESPQATLPRYVALALASLADEHEISGLLGKLTP
jgi:ubiquitin-protein ligase E3 C